MFRLTILCSLIVFLEGYAYPQDSHINLVLFIDGDLVKSGIYDSYFIIDNNDTISFKYEIGDILVRDSNFQKLQLLPLGTDILINFRYRLGGDLSVFAYSIKLKKEFLFQRFLLLRLYNYANKENSKFFENKSGYGFEVESPLGIYKLPKKRPQKGG